MTYRVKELARLAGVTVRTLHHYDRIGLLTPAQVNEAGYRFYGDDEVARLQQILFFKELDFKLSEIAEIMESDDYDVKAALRLQRKLLLEKRRRLDELLATIDATLVAQKKGIAMCAKSRFAAFDKETAEKYKEEATKLYGEKIVKESHARVLKMSKGEYERLAEDFNEICQSLVPHIDSKLDSPPVVEAMERLHEYLNRFYDCKAGIFAGLGELYCQDERFKEKIESFHKELPQFMKKAMKHYAKKIAA